MDLIPEFNDSNLRILINRLEETGKNRVLRLFACWCAQQLSPDNAGWVELSYTAEKLANGSIDENQVKTIGEEYASVAAAVWAVGWKHNAANAAVF